ncbi:hypothetical protein RG47T_4666 [Mucilaginibacter polytrichastri]|uniref:Single-stranded DNA-binding protein n=2 Tax=Mucilaginibacter polytrichastri TaxID=1302689 RepID=A0A1Q6A596_9SPHI|nr:hypothetical protein RG47T_4666 [Mucilaginibacter polytrichastri]
MVTTEFIKKNGASVEHIEWHQVKIPHNYVDADNVLKKGQLVYIQGKIQTLQFTDEQHIKRYKTEIMAQYIQILSNNIEQTLVQD